MIIPKGPMPIKFGRDIDLDPQEAVSFGSALSAAYASAEPFPHIVIDDFLPRSLADAILDNFPAAPRSGDINFSDDNFEFKKRAISPYDCSGVSRLAFMFFNSAPFIQFLQSVTNIEGLIPDPYYAGGGFHEISRGGKLGVHADFRIQNRIHLHRRINVLIYLNKDWLDSYGGELELWDSSMTFKVQSVLPIFNRCVMFNTEADAYHGHPDPLNCPEDMTRKSIALYYYTASRAIYAEAENITTLFKARPDDDLALKTATNAQNLKLRSQISQWIPPILYWKMKRLLDGRNKAGRA